MGIINIRAASAQYDVTVGSGILGDIGLTSAAAIKGRNVAVVTDEHVAPLYLKAVEDSLCSAGFTVFSLVLPAGEHTKSMETLVKLYSFFSQSGITRTDGVVALGGGVIGDVAGFAAATWLRGVPLVQIPTTLLAQVDSSVGGKTAVDLPEGKNLAGVFYQPCAVIADTETLKTLLGEIVSDGMAEVIKYGCIRDARLFDTLYQGIDPLCCPSVIEDCIRIKRDVVEKDERDTGEREILNFGHTAGHAIESLGGFQKWSHGQGVAIGMVLAARIGELLGVTEEGTSKKIETILQQYHLPTSCPYEGKELIQFMKKDKKRMSDAVSFILLPKIGQAKRVPLTFLQLEELLSKIIA